MNTLQLHLLTRYSSREHIPYASARRY